MTHKEWMRVDRRLVCFCWDQTIPATDRLVFAQELTMLSKDRLGFYSHEYITSTEIVL